jgi:hypothetical protein
MHGDIGALYTGKLTLQGLLRRIHHYRRSLPKEQTLDLNKAK